MFQHQLSSLAEGLHPAAVNGLNALMQSTERNNPEIVAVQLSSLIGRVDQPTFDHTYRVTYGSTKIAEQLPLLPQIVRTVSIAAEVHDVGKMDGEFDELVSKRSHIRLTPAQRGVLLPIHTARGAQILGEVTQNSDKPSIFTALTHHFLVGGYPNEDEILALPCLTPADRELVKYYFIEKNIFDISANRLMHFLGKAQNAGELATRTAILCAPIVTAGDFWDAAASRRLDSDPLTWDEARTKTEKVIAETLPDWVLRAFQQWVDYEFSSMSPESNFPIYHQRALYQWKINSRLRRSGFVRNSPVLRPVAAVF